MKGATEAWARERRFWESDLVRWGVYLLPTLLLLMGVAAVVAQNWAPPYGYTTSHNYRPPLLPSGFFLSAGLRNYIYEGREMFKGGLAAVGLPQSEAFSPPDFLARLPKASTPVEGVVGQAEGNPELTLDYNAPIEGGLKNLHLKVVLGVAPEGGLLGGYRLVQRGEIYPRLVEDHLEIPFAYDRSEYSIYVLCLMAVLGGVLLGWLLNDYWVEPRRRPRL